MREPTSEQCEANAMIGEEGRIFMAAWYPSMGGYSGRCLVEFTTCTSGTPRADGDDGVDVYVWHDGEFPFSGTDREPVQLHHCAPSEFVKFGNLVQRVQRELVLEAKVMETEDA